MVNGIRANEPRGSKFFAGSQVRQETPEESRRTQRPKLFDYNNNDADNSSKTPNDKNQQASSQKFRQRPARLR